MACYNLECADLPKMEKPKWSIDLTKENSELVHRLNVSYNFDYPYILLYSEEDFALVQLYL